MNDETLPLRASRFKSWLHVSVSPRLGGGSFIAPTTSLHLPSPRAPIRSTTTAPSRIPSAPQSRSFASAVRPGRNACPSSHSPSNKPAPRTASNNGNLGLWPASARAVMITSGINGTAVRKLGFRSAHTDIHRGNQPSFDIRESGTHDKIPMRMTSNKQQTTRIQRITPVAFPAEDLVGLAPPSGTGLGLSC